MWELVKSDASAEEKGATLAAIDSVLALGIFDPIDPVEEAQPGVRHLAEQREQARAEKDWQRADILREEIKSHGWIVEDAGDGYRLKRHS